MRGVLHLWVLSGVVLVMSRTLENMAHYDAMVYRQDIEKNDQRFNVGTTMLGLGKYKTNRGETAYVVAVDVDEDGDERLLGFVMANPWRLLPHHNGDRCFVMDWNRFGALSDYDHKPWTQGCLDPKSYQTFTGAI